MERATGTTITNAALLAALAGVGVESEEISTGGGVENVIVPLRDGHALLFGDMAEAEDDAEFGWPGYEIDGEFVADVEIHAATLAGLAEKTAEIVALFLAAQTYRCALCGNGVADDSTNDVVLLGAPYGPMIPESDGRIVCSPCAEGGR